MYPAPGPNVVRLVHVTDTHFVPLAKRPVSRNEQYHEHIAAKWDAFCVLCQQLQAHIIAHSGDLNHIKAQGDYTPNDINRITDMLEKPGIPVIITPGNHDLTKSSMDNYDRTAFKAIVKAAKNTTCLSHLNASGLIQIEKYRVPGSNVVISALPYVPLHTFVEMSKAVQTWPLLDPNDINITMLHVDALPSPDALPLPFQTLTWAELTTLWPQSDALLLGHIHEGFPFGQNLRVDGRTQLISKPWSFARNVNNLYVRTQTLEARHRPAIAVLDIDTVARTISAQYIEIPHEPFEKAFNLTTLKQEVAAAEKVSSMVESIKAALTAGQGIGAASNAHELMAKMAAEQNIDQRIVQKAADYLTAAGVKQ